MFSEEKNEKEISESSSESTEKEEIIFEDNTNQKSKKLQVTVNTSILNKYINKQHSKIQSLIFLLVFVIFFIIFSIIFALLNTLNSTTIAKGVYVKGINLSGLTIEEATSKLEQAFSIELGPNLNLVYLDNVISVETSDIDFNYNIASSVQNAYEIGKTGNLIIDNYQLLWSLFFKQDLSLSYSYNKIALEKILDDFYSSLPGTVVQSSYYIDGESLYIEKGKSGLTFDYAKVENEIIKSIYNRNAIEILQNKAYIKDTININVFSVDPKKIDIETIYSEIYSEPQDAYYNEKPFEIVSEKNGIDFAISIQEAKDIINSNEAEEYVIPLIITPAEHTINDIGTEVFPYKVSTYSTKYDASNKDRSENLRLAAAKINGKVLMPGDTFSFNGVVGKRTIEDGYRNAKIYENGKVVDGLAGRNLPNIFYII